MPEGAHVLPGLEVCPKCGTASCLEDAKLTSGWTGLPFVEIDGQNWPLEFAAKMLEMPVRDLADLVRITELPPAGTIRMASYRRQGRQPRAYPASQLIKIAEAMRALSDALFPDSADSD